MTHVEAYSRLAGVYDEIVIDPCHDRWASYLHELWSTDPQGVRSVLDLCCGTGLLAGELIARGYRVTGVDAADAMLARARERLGHEVALSRVTLPDLAVDGVFDAAVCTFDGFNYLTPDELGLTMAAVANRLRPGGWLVFDLHTDAMMDFTIANAVVAGTATAVSGRVQRRQAARWDQQDAQQYQEQPQQAQAPPEEDSTAQLQNLAQLHSQGVLTDEEFAAAKAKILGL